MVDLLTPPPGPVIGYDYGDIDDGIGYTTFYASDSVDTASTVFLLTKPRLYSTDIEYEMTATETISFYSGSFSRSKNLEGTAIINFMAEAPVANWVITVKLYHYRSSGPTTTQIGSTWTAASLVSPNKTTINARIVAPRTKFKNGDQIMFSITGTTAGAGNLEIGIDPQNRDGAYLQPGVTASETTQCILFAPFKLTVGV